MKQEEASRSWAQELAVEIGRSVRLIRGRRGLSAEQLSSRCAELGHAIPRNTIANLENGRKETVPVHELIVLAQALDVPPIELMYPVGRAAAVDVLPGVEWPPMRAAEWFSGNEPLTPVEDESTDAVESPGERLFEGTAIGLYREHRSHVRAWLDARAQAKSAGAGDEDRARWKRWFESELSGIRWIRARCEELGIEPPPIEIHDAEAAAELSALIVEGR